MRVAIALILLALAGCETTADREWQERKEAAYLEQMTPAQRAQYELAKQQLALQQQALGMQQAAAGAAILQRNAAPPSTPAQSSFTCMNYGTMTTCN